MKRHSIHILLLALLALGGCKLSDKQWDISMLVPLANADLTVGNMVKDSNLKTYPDSSLYLVDVQPLQSLNISSLLKVPDTTFEKTVSLKTINLGTRTLNDNITLAQVAHGLGLTGALLIASNGQKEPVPPISNISVGQTPINAQSFFTTATFIAGNLELDIHNGFPVEITNVHFLLQNQSNLDTIINDTINSILPGATHESNYSLAGKTVNGNLVLNILSMSSPGSGSDSVLVDTTNAISITITGSGMSVYSATAVFPAQNVVNDMVDINYNLNGPLFNYFIIRSGIIAFTTKSTIKDSMYLFYSIPGAVKGGSPIAENMVVPPAGKKDTLIQKTFPLGGYDVDLTGQHHDTLNTFYNILQVRIDSTGKLESLSLADSIYIYYALLSVVPEYAKGYLGTKTYTVGPQSSSFSALSGISVNKLTVPKLQATLQVTNGVGAPATAKIRSITAFNSKTNQSVPLVSSKWINVPIDIPAAKDTLTPGSLSIPLDQTNSNINELLQILPDKILYLFDFTLDPKGNTSHFNDFIYYGSTIGASLNIQLPLQVGVDGLVIEDTVSTKINSTVDLTRVQDGTMHINITNGYPVQAKIQVYVLDNKSKITDSLLGPTANTIPSASPDGSIPGAGTVNISLTQAQWQEISQKQRLIVKATLSTAQKKVVKIYSNSHLKVKITGEFRYRASTTP